MDSPYRRIPADQRMGPHYRGKTVLRLGIGHFLMAILTISLQVILTCLRSYGWHIGCGFWAGGTYMIAGIIAFYSSSDQRRRGPAIALLILSLCAMGTAVAAAILSLSFALQDRPAEQETSEEDWTLQLIFLATMTVIAVAEFFISLLSIHLVCKGLCHCCVAVQQAIETEASNVPAVVYTPDKSMSPIPA